MADESEDLGAVVEAGIAATLRKEARRNEQLVAAVRVVVLLLLLVLEAWLLTSGSVLGTAGTWLAGGSLLYAVVAVALWTALSRGWWQPWLPWVAVTGDVAFFGFRQGTTVYLKGAESFVGDQDLAVVMGFCCVLVFTSAMRVSRSLVLYAAALAGVVYLGFAMVAELERFFILLQLIFLVAALLATLELMQQVTRAVQGEIRRLTVARLLPGPVLDDVDADPVALITKPRSVTATVVVTDIRGFTQWSEHRSPLEVLKFLNRVQGGLADIVHGNGGTVDKFMGDGMLAVFGAPLERDDHAERALDAVERMMEMMANEPEVKLGVGVHSGELVVGCLGSGVRLEFTILGDTVNTASRLEAKTKELGVDVVISETTAAATERPLVEVETLAIRGRQQGMTVHTLP